MLAVMVREFVAICTYLEKSSAKKVKGFLIIGRSDLELLLDRNKYLTSLEKLKRWKALKWIDADPDQTTKKVCVEGKRKRCVKLDIGVYETLKDLLERTQR